MKRLILGVLSGYVLIGILVVITDRIFEAMVPGFAGAATPPRSYFLMTLGTDFLYSVIGGYICAWIAAERAHEATISLIALGETIGVASQFLLWHSEPHWFGLGLLVIYVVAIWIGSRLRPEQRAATA